MLKINFHGDKNQFPANFCARYACTGNTLIWLAGIRGKTFSVATRAQVTLSFDWLAFAVKLVRWPRTSFTGNASQSNESVTCANVASAGKKIDFYHRGNWFLSPWKMDFYHLGNWFLPPWKIDFYYLGNSSLPPWILIFTTMENYFLPLGNFFF